GMLVAVQQFVQQTLASKSGALNELKYGSHSIFFFRGVHTVAAAVANEGDAESLNIMCWMRCRTSRTVTPRRWNHGMGMSRHSPGSTTSSRRLSRARDQRCRSDQPPGIRP